MSIPKKIDLNWSYKAFAQGEELTLCQDRAFASSSCVLSFLVFIGFSKFHTPVLSYLLIGEGSTTV